MKAREKCASMGIPLCLIVGDTFRDTLRERLMVYSYGIIIRTRCNVE